VSATRTEARYDLATLRKAWGAGRRGRRQQSLWAFSVTAGGDLEYCGKVVKESAEAVRIECCDAVMFFFGLFQLTGELQDVPRDRVRVFTDRKAMLGEATEIYRRGMLRHKEAAG